MTYTFLIVPMCKKYANTMPLSALNRITLMATQRCMSIEPSVLALSFEGFMRGRPLDPSLDWKFEESSAPSGRGSLMYSV